MKYKYELLNYWNDQDDLYVNYTVENLETNEIANCIDYHNTSERYRFPEVILFLT